MSSSPATNYTRIGRRIRELRIQNCISRKQLAAKTQLMPEYISRLEEGHEVPQYETLLELAEALGVPLYRLFYRDKQPLSTPRLTRRPTLDELVVESCIRSSATSVFGGMCQIVISRIEAGLQKVLPSFPGHRPGNGPR